MKKDACKQLASAVINMALKDYQDNYDRAGVRAFLMGPRFKLFADLADQPVDRIRRLFMEDKCKKCVNRYKEKLCVKCYETDPTKNHSYFKLDTRKEKGKK